MTKDFSKKKKFKKKETSRALQFFVGLFFALFGGGITYFKAIPDIKLAHESTKWVKAQGVILSSKVTTKTETRKGRQKTLYGFQLSYSYEVGKRTLRGNQVTIGSGGFSSTDSSGAYDLLKKYPKDKEVIVYYSPKVPTNAALVTGLKSGHILFLVAASIFTLVGVLILYSLTIKKKPKKKVRKKRRKRSIE
jgi:hypothetical protein